MQVHRAARTSSTWTPRGERAYVANSGSNNVSVLDLEKRREIAVWGGRVAGNGAGFARRRTLVVTNRVGGSAIRD